MIKKLLIANRGEIVPRIIRTARQMGIATVAVHSEADKGAPFTQAADEAVLIGPANPAQSYLNMEAIIAAAREERGRRGASGLRLPLRARGLCPGGGRRGPRLGGPPATGAQGHQLQVLHPPAGGGGGGRGDPRHPGAGERARGGGGLRRGARLPPVPQAGQGRRRQGHRDGVRARPGGRGVQAGLLHRGHGLRLPGLLHRDRGGPSEAHRGAVRRRPGGPGGVPGRARVLHPAPPPEDHRGGALPGGHARRPREDVHQCHGHRQEDGLRGRGHPGGPARGERRILLHGGKRPAPGGASGERVPHRGGTSCAFSWRSPRAGPWA